MLMMARTIRRARYCASTHDTFSAIPYIKKGRFAQRTRRCLCRNRTSQLVSENLVKTCNRADDVSSNAQEIATSGEHDGLIMEGMIPIYDKMSNASGKYIRLLG